MASIGVGGGHSARKAVDSELPLVPFIDLLLCCVMFLLVTAVWNQLAAVEVSAPSGTPAAIAAPPTPSLTLSLRTDGWLLVTPESARFEIPTGDLEALRTALRSGRDGHEAELSIATDDGVPYASVIAAIDVAVGEGIGEVSMAGDGSR